MKTTNNNKDKIKGENVISKTRQGKEDEIKIIRTTTKTR